MSLPLSHETTGVTLASVHKNQRSFASSNATLLYNLLGYFGGPTLCGLIAEHKGGVEYGFYVVLAFSGVGVILVALALYVWLWSVCSKLPGLYAVLSVVCALAVLWSVGGCVGEYAHKGGVD